MIKDLTRKDLETLIKGYNIHYSEFNNPLVLKAGHTYNDQYSRTSWYKLEDLTNAELWTLKTICAQSWKNNMEHIQPIILEDLTDEELLFIVKALQQEHQAEDSIVRTLAIQFFGGASLVQMLTVSAKVLQVVADRLRKYV